MDNQTQQGKYMKIATYIFLALVFIAPLAFIPSLYASLDLVKAEVISVGVLLTCILYTISVIKNRTIVLEHNTLGYIILALCTSIVVSMFLSTSISKSFMGQGFEIGTASFLLLMFLTTYIVSRLAFKNKEIIVKIYSILSISFIILAVFHIARIIGGTGFMSFGILSAITSTVLGKWFDFSILAGIVALISFFGLKFGYQGMRFKILLSCLLVLCGFLIFITNSSFVWIAIAVIALCFGIYEYHTSLPQGEGFRKIFSRVSLLTLIVFIIATACAWKGDVLARTAIQKFNTGQSELILPWQLTLDVATDTIKESPLFGAGPNRFGYQFLKFKPQGINPTQFWSSEFPSGSGTLPTFVVTQGVVGAVLWFIFLLFFVRYGIYALRRVSDPFHKFLVSSSFFISIFLWLVNIMYIPSHVIVFLTFVFTGLAIASFKSEGLLPEKTITKYSNIIFTIILVVLVLWLGLYVKKFIGLTSFQGGIKALNTGKPIDDVQTYFKKALSTDASDTYYQALSEVDIMKINSLAQTLQSQSTAGTKQDPQITEQIIALIGEAVNYTKNAIDIDPTNYYNYVSQAHVFEIASSFNIPNAYDGAKSAYTKALKYNPYNPSIYLNLARLDASQKKYDTAQQYVGNALGLKQNYIEAIFLLSQIQIANGQIKEAIVSSKVATEINPQDLTLFFQLGFLYYNDKDYASAVTALEKAVELNTQYANARYFLGLSYARLGRNEDAIKQFEELAKTNPTSQEVAFILSNLKAGKSPFTNVRPPIDNSPEKRVNLPLSEKSSTSVKTTTTSLPVKAK